MAMAMAWYQPQTLTMMTISVQCRKPKWNKRISFLMFNGSVWNGSDVLNPAKVDRYDHHIAMGTKAAGNKNSQNLAIYGTFFFG